MNNEQRPIYKICIQKLNKFETLQTKMTVGYNKITSKDYYCQIRYLSFNLRLYQKLNSVLV